jgi:hypothetical protein
MIIDSFIETKIHDKINDCSSRVVTIIYPGMTRKIEEQTDSKEQLGQRP